MASSEERREAAAKLRERPVARNIKEAYVSIVQAVGVRPCLLSHEGESGDRFDAAAYADALDHLADLIDPTCLTTTIRVMHGDENVVGDICCSCESCNGGWHWSKYDAAPRFCPHCGAEVVKVVYDHD